MKGKTNTGLTVQSDADQINKYLMGHQARLSDSLRKKLDRLQVAADYLRKYGSRMKVAKMLQNLWPNDCSRATAYRYIEEAQEVFAPQQMADRSFYVDTLLGFMFQTREKALAKQDLKTVAATEKNIMGAILKFFGTNEDLPLDKLQAPNIVVGFFPEKHAARLPENWQVQVEQMLATRRTGVVADQEAEVIPEPDNAAEAELEHE